MTEVLFISRFWGIIFVTLGVLYLFRKDLINKVIEDSKDEKFSLGIGFMSIALGVATFLLASGNDIVLKIIGLLSFVKGITLMAFPKWRYKVVKPLENRPMLVRVMLVIVILLGIYLLSI